MGAHLFKECQPRQRRMKGPGASSPSITGARRSGWRFPMTLRLTAQPLTTLMRTNREKDLARLRDICRKNAVRLIIVGHPLHLTGEAGEMADEAARFAEPAE